MHSQIQQVNLTEDSYHRNQQILVSHVDKAKDGELVQPGQVIETNEQRSMMLELPEVVFVDTNNSMMLSCSEGGPIQQEHKWKASVGVSLAHGSILPSFNVIDTDGSLTSGLNQTDDQIEVLFVDDVPTKNPKNQSQIIRTDENPGNIEEEQIKEIVAVSPPVSPSQLTALRNIEQVVGKESPQQSFLRKTIIRSPPDTKTDLNLSTHFIYQNINKSPPKPDKLTQTEAPQLCDRSCQTDEASEPPVVEDMKNKFNKQIDIIIQNLIQDISNESNQVNFATEFNDQMNVQLVDLKTQLVSYLPEIVRFFDVDVEDDYLQMCKDQVLDMMDCRSQFQSFMSVAQSEFSTTEIIQMNVNTQNGLDQGHYQASIEILPEMQVAGPDMNGQDIPEMANLFSGMAQPHKKLQMKRAVKYYEHLYDQKLNQLHDQISELNANRNQIIQEQIIGYQEANSKLVSQTEYLLRSVRFLTQKDSESVDRIESLQDDIECLKQELTQTNQERDHYQTWSKNFQAANEDISMVIQELLKENEQLKHQKVKLQRILQNSIKMEKERKIGNPVKKFNDRSSSEVAKHRIGSSSKLEEMQKVLKDPSEKNKSHFQKGSSIPKLVSLDKARKQHSSTNSRRNDKSVKSIEGVGDSINIQIPSTVDIFKINQMEGWTQSESIPRVRELEHSKKFNIVRQMKNKQLIENVKVPVPIKQHELAAPAVPFYKRKLQSNVILFSIKSNRKKESKSLYQQSQSSRDTGSPPKNHDQKIRKAENMIIVENLDESLNQQSQNMYFAKGIHKDSRDENGQIPNDKTVKKSIPKLDMKMVKTPITMPIQRAATGRNTALSTAISSQSMFNQFHPQRSGGGCSTPQMQKTTFGKPRLSQDMGRSSWMYQQNGIRPSKYQR